MANLTRVFACACIALVSWRACAQDVANVITLSNGEWQPYMSQYAPHYGVVSRIVSEAFALEGITVKYVFLPWTRAFVVAESGDLNGSIIWAGGQPGSSRIRDFYFSDTVFEAKSVFFHLKSVPFEWNSFADLNRVSVGGTAGYTYKFENDPKIKVDRAASDELSFRKLLAGRFQVFPSNQDTARRVLRDRFTAQEMALIVAHPTPYATTGYHLILSRRIKDNARFLALFNHGLQRLKANGKFAQYMADLEKGGY